MRHSDIVLVVIVVPLLQDHVVSSQCLLLELVFWWHCLFYVDLLAKVDDWLGVFVIPMSLVARLSVAMSPFSTMNLVTAFTASFVAPFLSTIVAYPSPVIDSQIVSTVAL
eukprot:6487169-Amphidinium_carterae.2